MGKGDLKSRRGKLVNGSYGVRRRNKKNQSAGKPADKPVVKPVDKPAVKPVDKPAVKPAVKPADKPVVKPVDKPADKSDDKSVTVKAVKTPVAPKPKAAPKKKKEE